MITQETSDETIANYTALVTTRGHLRSEVYPFSFDDVEGASEVCADVVFNRGFLGNEIELDNVLDGFPTEKLSEKFRVWMIESYDFEKHGSFFPYRDLNGRGAELKALYSVYRMKCLVQGEGTLLTSDVRSALSSYESRLKKAWGIELEKVFDEYRMYCPDSKTLETASWKNRWHNLSYVTCSKEEVRDRIEGIVFQLNRALVTACPRGFSDLRSFMQNTTPSRRNFKDVLKFLLNLRARMISNDRGDEFEVVCKPYAASILDRWAVKYKIYARPPETIAGLTDLVPIWELKSAKMNHLLVVGGLPHDLEYLIFAGVPHRSDQPCMYTNVKGVYVRDLRYVGYLNVAEWCQAPSMAGVYRTGATPVLDAKLELDRMEGYMSLNKHLDMVFN